MEDFFSITKHSMKNLASKKFEGSLNIYINLSWLLYVFPCTSELIPTLAICDSVAQRLEGFKTSPCPSPSLEMGQLWALRKQAHCDPIDCSTTPGLGICLQVSLPKIHLL